MVLTRRTVLRSVTLASAAATAGCLAGSDGGTRLGAFTVSNFDDAPHEFTLRVQEGEDVVHRSTHAVEARAQGRIDGATAPCEWGGKPGDYTVGVRVDGSDWTTKSLEEDMGLFENPDCLTARAQYEEDGTVRIESEEDCRRFEGAWLVGSPCARTGTTTDS
jgi:hypothetical protein